MQDKRVAGAKVAGAKKAAGGRASDVGNGAPGEGAAKKANGTGGAAAKRPTGTGTVAVKRAAGTGTVAAVKRAAVTGRATGGRNGATDPVAVKRAAGTGRAVAVKRAAGTGTVAVKRAAGTGRAVAVKRGAGTGGAKAATRASGVAKAAKTRTGLVKAAQKAAASENDGVATTKVSNGRLAAPPTAVGSEASIMPVRVPRSGDRPAPSPVRAPFPQPVVAPAAQRPGGATHFSDNARVQEWLARIDATGILGRDKAANASSPYTPVIRRMRWVISVLLFLGICGFLIDGANRPANPRLVPVNNRSGMVGLRSPPTLSTANSVTKAASADMHSALLTVSPASDRPACVLEAVTSTEQNHGLMDRTSVAPYAGMVFVFGAPSTDLFYMKDTMIPLSIAWFGPDGRLIRDTEMPPCPTSTVNCPTYGAGVPYTLALEVPAGGLAALGIGPGASVHLGGSCS